ncbi:hypothetical protein HDU97_007494 [Phlyctochytrium planicorne]|nr:hypothetical protein HDU97_007494 [Phlyctochytrium planicorne]
MGNICLEPFREVGVEVVDHSEEGEIENMQDPGEMLYLRQSLSHSVGGQMQMQMVEAEDWDMHERPPSSASTARTLRSQNSTFFATLLSAVPTVVGSRRCSGETLRTSMSFQRQAYLTTGEKGPLILPRTSSLTTLILDTTPIIESILAHMPYREVQKFSRLSKSWRKVAGSILKKYTVFVTLGWDFEGREWSAPAFVVNEYSVDEMPSLGRMRLGIDSDSEDEEEYARPHSAREVLSLPSLKPSTKITVYRPVTFNMEDCAPGPLPGMAGEINQIKITPLTAAPPRTFFLDRGDSTFPMTPSAFSNSRRNTRTLSTPIDPFTEDDFEDIDVNTPRTLVHSSSMVLGEEEDMKKMDVVGERCVRGRVPAKDYGSFCETIFGKTFSLVLNPSGNNFETLSVVSKEWKKKDEGALLDMGNEKAAVSSVPEEEGNICSEARLNQLKRYVKEIGGSQTILDSIVSSVAVKRYLSCPEAERVWAFRYVIETLLEPSDPERGHHELNDTINRLDKIAHRVEILSQVGLPGSQRMDRLRSYYAEGSRAWRSIVGGDIALRVAGYTGNLGNDDAVYRFLSSTLLPIFT